MSQENSNANGTTDPLKLAVGIGVQRVNNPALTPTGRVEAVLRWLDGFPIHDAHRDKVAGMVHDFVRVAVELLSNMDYLGLRQEIEKFRTAIMYGGFTQAPPEKSQFDTWRFRASDLEWRSDFNTLINWLQPGEKINRMDREKAVTSTGRTITLRSLWLSRKPANDPTPDHIWLEQRVHQRTTV